MKKSHYICGNVAGLLKKFGECLRAAMGEFVPLVEQKIRRQAHRYENRDYKHITLQTAALVSDAYLRLDDSVCGMEAE